MTIDISIEMKLVEIINNTTITITSEKAILITKTGSKMFKLSIYKEVISDPIYLKS